MELCQQIASSLDRDDFLRFQQRKLELDADVKHYEAAISQWNHDKNFQNLLVDLCQTAQRDRRQLMTIIGLSPLKELSTTQQK